MLKWYFHRYVRAGEQRYGYDASYLHEMADTSLSAAVRFMIMQRVAGYWRADAPRDAWCAAAIASALVEDCGPCVQITTDMALGAGMKGEAIRALLSGAPTDPDAQLGFDYGRALLDGSDGLDELRDRIERKWGKKALVAISLRAMTGRNFPVLKRAMGHAQACQRVRVGKDDVIVHRALKAA